MNALRNKVQLLGHVGQEPEVKILQGGKKLAKITLATNEVYFNENKEKVTTTHWHNLTAWGKTADIVENFVNKGKEIMIEGKLIYNKWEDKNGEKRYSAEIVVQEILLLNK